MEEEEEEAGTTAQQVPQGVQVELKRDSVRPPLHLQRSGNSDSIPMRCSVIQWSQAQEGHKARFY